MTPRARNPDATSASKSRFRQACEKHGIICRIDSSWLINKKELKALVRALLDLSPGRHTSEEYNYIVQTTNESTTRDEMTSVFFEEFETLEYRSALDEVLSNFPRNLPLNHHIAAARPDWLEGPDISTLGKIPIEDRLRGYVCPGAVGIALPHFTGEYKASKRPHNLQPAIAQVAYTGACLVEARRQVLARMGRADKKGYGAVLSFVTNGRTILFFAHHSHEQGGRREYYINQIGKTDITDDAESFEQGRCQVRNLQNLGRRTAEKLRDEVVEFYTSEEQMQKRRQKEKREQRKRERRRQKQRQSRPMQSRQRQGHEEVAGEAAETGSEAREAGAKKRKRERRSDSGREEKEAGARKEKRKRTA